MKKVSVILLILLSVSIISPFTVSADRYNDSEKTVIVALDICNITDTPLTSGFEVPALHETSELILRPGAAGYIENLHQKLSSLLIPFQQEKPPRA